MGLKAGEELEDLLWPREDCLRGRRNELDEFTVVAVPEPLGSKEVGIDMNDGLPIVAPIGPKVGVDPADFIVAGELSALALGSKVMVLSSCGWTFSCCRWSCCCRVIFKNDEGVAGDTSEFDGAFRFCL